MQENYSAVEPENYNDAPASDSLELSTSREVSVFMLPIKQKGMTRKLLITLLAKTSGPNATLGWAMHWVIRIGDSCFELQRFAEAPYTRLKVSHWNGSRADEVLQYMSIGRTQLDDATVETMGTRLFHENANIRYDLFMNNCQTFVSSMAWSICSGHLQKDRYFSIPLPHVLSYAVAKTFCLFAIPTVSLYMRWQGCDHAILAEFEQVAGFWAYWILPMSLHNMFSLFEAAFVEIEKSINDPSVSPRTVRLFGSVLASVMLFGMALVQPLFVAGVSFPLPERFANRCWRLRWRPSSVPKMNAAGAMTNQSLAKEEPMSDDRSSLVSADGRFANTKDWKVPESYIIALTVAGSSIAIVYWCCRMARCVLVHMCAGRWTLWHDEECNTTHPGEQA